MLALKSAFDLFSSPVRGGAASDADPALLDGVVALAVVSSAFPNFHDFVALQHAIRSSPSSSVPSSSASVAAAPLLLSFDELLVRVASTLNIELPERFSSPIKSNAPRELAPADIADASFSPNSSLYYGDGQIFGAASPLARSGPLGVVQALEAEAREDMLAAEMIQQALLFEAATLERAQLEADELERAEQARARGVSFFEEEAEARRVVFLQEHDARSRDIDIRRTCERATMRIASSFAMRQDAARARLLREEAAERRALDRARAMELTPTRNRSATM